MQLSDVFFKAIFIPSKLLFNAAFIIADLNSALLVISSVIPLILANSVSCGDAPNIAYAQYLAPGAMIRTYWNQNPSSSYNYSLLLHFPKLFCDTVTTVHQLV